jgi:aminoglycoside phosphotransferase (APT) family kinase protein
MVVRVEPQPTYQVFLDTNFLEQYRVTEGLGRAGATVPGVVGFEEDRSVLGDRFYVMERATGLAGDPGMEWVKALDAAQTDQLWRAGLAAMAEIHTADWRGLGLEFLDQQHRGADPLTQQLHYYREYYEWVREGESRPVIEFVFDWLTREMPQSAGRECISWGDARPGNQLFSSPDRCEAVIDLEQASLGTAETDLGWWCFIEDRRRPAFGLTCPDLDHTVELYGELIGRPVEAIDYYIVFAAFRIAVLLIKLHRLRAGQPDQYPKYSGDETLARTLLRFVPDRLTAQEAAMLREHSGTKS